MAAARELASSSIRVVTIAPDTFDTPMIGTVPDEARAIAATIPFPQRLGDRTNSRRSASTARSRWQHDDLSEGAPLLELRDRLGSELERVNRMDDRLELACPNEPDERLEVFASPAVTAQDRQFA